MLWPSSDGYLASGGSGIWLGGLLTLPVRASQYHEGFWYSNATGLMGLAWKTSQNVDTPFWQTIAPSWNDTRFGVYLARANATDLADAARVNKVDPAEVALPGGSITFG